MSGTATRATWVEVRTDEDGRDDDLVRELYDHVHPLLAAGEPLRALAIASRVAEMILEMAGECGLDPDQLPWLLPLTPDDLRALEGCALLLHHRAREALRPPLGMPRPEERRLYAAVEERAGAQALEVLARLRAETIFVPAGTIEEGSR